MRRRSIPFRAALSGLVLVALASLATPATATAQRRRASAPAPIDVQLSTGARAYEVELRIVARADVELAEDLRLLHLEVRPEGVRRALTCDAPDRPRRLDPSARRSLRSGEVWTERFDVRRICWGRALDALSRGATVGGSYGLSRGRAAPVVARAAGVDTRSVALSAFTFAAIAPPAPPAGDVRVSMPPADAATGARVSFHVSVRSARAVRALVRLDHFRFRVTRPDGTSRTCSMPHAPSAAIPDLFARLSPRGGRVYALDVGAYCDPDTFDRAGIYEVTPALELDASGEEWGMDTPLGTFLGTPVPVRIRADLPRRGRT
ncbi:MAG: hypothetical protein U0234_00965 [Sandaracinus sp.]